MLRMIRRVMRKYLRILLRVTLRIATDVVSLMSLTVRSRAQLAAENLFRRKQVALYLERHVKPRR